MEQNGIYFALFSKISWQRSLPVFILLKYLPGFTTSIASEDPPPLITSIRPLPHLFFFRRGHAHCGKSSTLPQFHMHLWRRPGTLLGTGVRGRSGAQLQRNLRELCSQTWKTAWKYCILLPPRAQRCSSGNREGASLRSHISSSRSREDGSLRGGAGAGQRVGLHIPEPQGSYPG